MKKINFYLVVLAILFSLFLNKEVNRFVNFIIPSTKIGLKILDTDKQGLVLLETDEKVKISDIKTDSNIEFIPKGKYGYTFNALWLKNNNKEIELEIKKLPNLKISFYNIAAQKLEITLEKNKKVIDLEKNNQGEIVDYFPFANSKLFMICTIGIYILLSFFIYIVLVLLFTKKIYKKMNFLSNYTPFKIFFIIYTLISLYVSYKFMFNALPKSLYINGEFFGDQRYYWELGNYLFKGQYAEILKRSYTFRGYITFTIPAIAQMVGYYLKINSHWLFTMINNFFIAILLAYIIPEIYNQISGKKSKNYHIIVLFLIFSFFWKAVYYSILFDIFGVTFLLWMILKILKLKNKKDIFLAGIFGGIAALCRGNYVWAIIILFLVKTLYELIKNKKISLPDIFFFWLGVIFICLPQIKINYDLGYIGLFPFDKMGSYGPVPDERLTVFLINESMRDLFLTYPMLVGDKTSQQILINFSQGTRLTMNQILSAFIYSPIETIIVIVKKIFLALDTRTNETYPKELWNLTFFSLINYFIISTSLFFLKDKIFTKKEKILGILLFVSVILPQTIMTVEWRYYIVLYLIVYYIFTFKFVSLIEENEKFKELKNEGYFKFISFAIVVFFVISSYYIH